MDGQFIQTMYTWYQEGLFSVDRRYQRKLVWTLKEKQALIDTILRGYPLPLFMLVSDQPENSKAPKAVMDGLQRLEAIFSFIDNDFPVFHNGKFRYFNLDGIPGKGAEIRAGKLKQREPFLDDETTSAFLLYQLPVSIINASISDIEEIFKRINSTGRKLSVQSLRQAGILSSFSDCVQQIASIIRGDYTKENVVTFSHMKSLSLSDKDLDYGINTPEVFWIRNDIINDKSLRRSKDEEIIANILNYALNGSSVFMTRNALDALYNPKHDSYKRNELSLSDESRKQYIFELILKIFDVLDNVSQSANQSLAELICGDPCIRDKDLIFIVLFLAILNLYRKNYVVDNYKAFATTLAGIASKEMKELVLGTDAWNPVLRERLIARITPILQSAMKYLEFDPAWNNKAVNILKKAKVESQLYDFKIGTYDFSRGCSAMHKVLKKCICTLIAMANSNPGKEACIIFGVADNAKSAESFSSYYNTKVLHCNDSLVVGIDSEALRFYTSVDLYLQAFKEEMRKLLPLAEGAVASIMSSLDTVRYDDRTLVILKFSTTTPVIVDNCIYIRSGNCNQTLSNKNMRAVMDFYTEFTRRLAVESAQDSKTLLFTGKQ